LLPPDDSRRLPGGGNGSERSTPRVKYREGQRDDNPYEDIYHAPEDFAPRTRHKYGNYDGRRQAPRPGDGKHLAAPKRPETKRISMTTTILPGESRVRDSIAVEHLSGKKPLFPPGNLTRASTWHPARQDIINETSPIECDELAPKPIVPREDDARANLIPKGNHDYDSLPDYPSTERERSNPISILPAGSRLLQDLLEEPSRSHPKIPAESRRNVQERIDTLRHGLDYQKIYPNPKAPREGQSISLTNPPAGGGSQSPDGDPVKQTPAIKIYHSVDHRLDDLTKAVAQLEKTIRPNSAQNPAEEHITLAVVAGDILPQQDIKVPTIRQTTSFDDMAYSTPDDNSQDIRYNRPGHPPPELQKQRNQSMVPSKPRIPSNPSTGSFNDKSYLYNELEWNEIRLVKILPARMAAIRCEIIHVSLDKPPSYIAISYAWGDAADTRKIQLHGNTISITSSLHGALDALRQKSEPVLVWADALCINQQNREERTQQVQLMTNIYSNANSVAIWLGQDTDESSLAIHFLCEVSEHADSIEKITRLIGSRLRRRYFEATVSLFERDYWSRLWVVQEVFNARHSISVYCGSINLPWSVFTRASQVFRRHKGDLDHYFPGGANDGTRHIVSQSQLTYSQVLVHQGPGSLSDLRSFMGLGEGSLLEVLRTCRRKLAADPRDKVFGILGVLPEHVRRDFQPDYSLSVKEVYTNVVDYLLSTTERLDVICEAIYFPLHTPSSPLPTWVPDWGHIPQTSALGLSYNFTASGTTTVEFKFLDDRRNKLEIAAIPLDTIHRHGIAVGTLCALADFLMAFLHWRALLLSHHDENSTGPNSGLPAIQDAFCRTLCLDQVPPKWSKNWTQVVHHLFASLLHSRLPHIPLDDELRSYLAIDVGINPDAQRRLLQEHIGARMMGRCFCLTGEGRLGMGSGFMAPDDVVVVPLGCYTPILLRPEGSRGEYRFVGDVYIHGYMRGKAVKQYEQGKRQLQKFVIH
jgi:hypothetical protein